MKKLKIITVTCFLSFICTTIFAQNATVLSGKILNNKYEEFTLKIAYQDDNINYGKAIINKDGTFSLKTNVTKPDIYRIALSVYDFFLIFLSPNENVSIVYDLEKPQDIISVSGSESMIFAKKAIDSWNSSKILIDSIQQLFQEDRSNIYYREFFQQFNLYMQTNQSVDRYITTAYETIDSLYALTASSMKKNKIDAKQLDYFLFTASKYLKDISNAYTPFQNYQNNISEHYNFKKNRIPNQEDFFKALDNYILEQNNRHQLAKQSLDPLISEIQNLVAFRDSLQLHDLLKTPKEKENFTNKIVKLVREYPAPKTKEEFNLAAEQEKSNASILMLEYQKETSKVTQYYQNMYNVESEIRVNTLKDMLLENKDKLVVLMFLDVFPRDQYPSLHQEITKALYAKYPNHPLVQERYKIENAPANSTSIGAMAPELAFENPDGKIMKLSDLKGKVVLIDFWASWCRPCRIENPNVVKEYQKYNKKGFEVYSVSLDRDKNSWIKAIADDNLSWPNHVSDLKHWGSEGAKIYGVSAIPATFLIDQNGRIVAKNLRGAELSKALKELLGE